MENRRLRDEHPEVSEHVDQEAKLERDVAELSERAQTSEQRAEESAGMAELYSRTEDRGSRGESVGAGEAAGDRAS